MNSSGFGKNYFTILATVCTLKCTETWARHLLPVSTAALVGSLAADQTRRCSVAAAGAHSHDSVMAGWMSHSGTEQRKERAGLYTPNNRCRPEAPLTSLPKLTPVKNVGRTVGRGGGEREEQQKIKK